MSKKYPETDQTFQALINLEASQTFVSFSMIYQEVKRIRIANGRVPEDDNTERRIIRSLVYNRKTAGLTKSVQGRELSISIRYPDYEIISEYPIAIKESGKIQDLKDVRENKFKLVKTSKLI